MPADDESGGSTLEEPIEGLLATAPSRLPYQPDVLIRSFLLTRASGNVIVYNSPGISSAAKQIRARGGASRLLVNHGHEGMYGTPAIDVPAFVHRKDRLETARSMRVAGVFTERTMIDDDLEVIPTPGHTRGTTSYLWDNGSHRFLFTGDFIWIERGEWKAVVLPFSNRSRYLESLSLVRDLDFDVLVPWGTTEGHPAFAVAGRDEIRERMDAVIARVRAGGIR